MRRLTLGVAATVLLLACGSGDDDDAGGPASGSTSTTVAPAEMTLTSTAFAEGTEIPVEHSCQGENTSPPLDWGGIPEGAVELALVVTDPDFGGFVHWVIAEIDPAATGLDVGEVPDGAVETVNDTTQPGYFGPCPPETHTYAFTLYALEQASGITASTTAAEAIEQLEPAALAQTELTGEYTPQG